jgi:hypothetical protein
MSALHDELHRMIGELNEEQTPQLLQIVKRMRVGDMVKPEYDSHRDPAVGLLAEFDNQFPENISENYEDLLFSDLQVEETEEN